MRDFVKFTVRYFHSLFNRLFLFFSFLFFSRNGFNILLYGLGSKRVLLDQFRSSKLSSYIQIVVNGYFPSLTIKSVSLLFIFLWYCNLLAQQFFLTSFLLFVTLDMMFGGKVFLNGEIITNMVAEANFHSK